MYGVQRLNSDTGHVDLQKRTADCACVAAKSAYAQKLDNFFKAIIRDNKAALYSNTLVRFKSLSNYQICICVFAYLL